MKKMIHGTRLAVGVVQPAVVQKEPSPKPKAPNLTTPTENSIPNSVSVFI